MGTTAELVPEAVDSAVSIQRRSVEEQWQLTVGLIVELSLVVCDNGVDGEDRTEAVTRLDRARTDLARLDTQLLRLREPRRARG